MDNNIIKLPNGRDFDLSKDKLTTEDYKALSGVEVRYIRSLQEKIVQAQWAEEQKKYFKNGQRLFGIF